MKEVTLGKIATFSQGQQIPISDQKTSRFENSDVFLRIINYTQNSNDFRFIPAQKEKYHVLKDDIIMVRYGAVGFVGRGLEGVLANNMFKINFDEKLVNPDYLFRVLWSKRVQRQLLNSAQSTSMAAVNFKTVARVKIPLPPLAEQKKIAAILDEADKLRRLNQALLEKYDALTQSLFLDMFGDLVLNPKGWEIITVRDIVDEVKYGTSAKAGEKGKYPYLRMNNITYLGYMDFLKLKYIDVDEKDYQKYSVKKGDVLFNRTNSKELVGKTGLITTDEEMIIAGYLIRVRVNENNNPYYLWAHLNSKWAKTNLKMMCKNIVGMANINAQELQNIKILKAPLSLQTQFAERIKKIEIQKSQAQASLAKSEELFNSLLQRAFKGELV